MGTPPPRLLTRSTLSQMPKDQNQQAEEPPDTEKMLLFLPYIKGVSEKIEHICYLLQVTPIFKSMNTRRQSTDEGEVKETGKMKKDVVYEIPCASVYIGDTGRSLQMRMKEYKYAVRAQPGHLG